MTGQEFLNAFPVLRTWLQTGALALLLAVIVLGIRRKLPSETCPKKLNTNRVQAKSYVVGGVLVILCLILLIDWSSQGKALLQFIHDLLV